MTRTRAARLLGLLVSLLALPLTQGGVAFGQSQAQEVFICHRTGSSTNPWVFMSIDASTWPEHEAEGDVRANSLAECPAPAPAPAAQQAAPIAPPAQPAQAVIGVPQASSAQAPPAAQVAAPAQAASSQVASPAQTSSQVASPAESPAQVANAQAVRPEQARSQVADVQAEAESAPPVSSLPASGEPDRPVLVLGLLTVLAAGLGLRRLGRRRHA
jgi:hypothetical protein